MILNIFIKAISIWEISGSYLANQNYTENSIVDCNFFNNTSTQGGSIFLYFPGNLTISGCEFYNNTAHLGSAIYFEESCKI